MRPPARARPLAIARLLQRFQRRRAFKRRQREGVQQVESDFLDWMSLAVAGMLDPGHRYLIDLAVGGLPSEDPVVEIGSFCGLSTSVIGHFLHHHGRSNTLIATDPWVFEGEGSTTLSGSDIPFEDYRRFVREQFERNVRFWSEGRLPHAFDLSSDEFFAAWEDAIPRVDLFGRETMLGGAISFCFIDGDHSFEQARRDFLHVDRWLVSGGFVLFDDSDEFGRFPQVHAVVCEAIQAHGYELVAANPHHLLRKVPDASE